MKNSGGYHDSYVQSDTFLSSDVFENFRNICIKTYYLDPARFYSAQRIVCITASRTAEVNFELLTDIDMLLTV